MNNIKIFSLLGLIFFMYSCEHKKEYLENKFIISVRDTGLYTIDNISSEGCVLMEEVSNLNDISEEDTIYLGVFFEKKFYSDSTILSNQFTSVGRGKNGLVRPIKSMSIYTIDSVGSKIQITEFLKSGNVQLLSFDNSFFDGDSIYFSQDGCVLTDSFSSFAEIQMELNQNTRKVYGENLRHPLFFKVPVSMLKSTRLEGEIKY